MSKSSGAYYAFFSAGAFFVLAVWAYARPEVFGIKHIAFAAACCAVALGVGVAAAVTS